MKTKIGLWAGLLSLLLASVSLSLGFIPLFQAFLNKPIVLKIPGQTALNLRLAGTYIGVASLQTLTPQEKRNTAKFDYWLSDSAEKDFFPVNRFPSRNYYSEKEEAQVPLFEMIVQKKGKYIFTADYPIGVEGPPVSVALHRHDSAHILSELIVGSVMFVLLGALGGVLLWKSKKV
jgi:hypothetical protein